MSKLPSSQLHEASRSYSPATDSQQVGGSICFEETVQSRGFFALGGLSHHCVSVYRRAGCVRLCAPVDALVCVCHRGKKSTGGSCTCAALWLSLDSALHITAWAWMLDLTEVTSMPHHPHKTHTHTHRQTHAFTQSDVHQTQTDRSTHTPGEFFSGMYAGHNADSGEMWWRTRDGKKSAIKIKQHGF